MSKPYILSVDDEDLNQEIVFDLLEDDFELNQVSSGQACLDSVAKKLPELILLDVNMPGLNGLETCKKLREDESAKDIPIIFLSALASPKERLQGYEAGGDDYITKPFDEDELITKINLFIKQISHKKGIKEQHQEATDTAMTAMVSNFESGHIIAFMRDVFTAQNDDELSNIIFETFHNLGIHGCLMLKHRKKTIYIFSDGVERPIEKEILAETFRSSDEKIIKFANRAILKNNYCAVLIRSMPEDDEKRGRYRDHLAIFIDGLEEKLKQFILEDHKLEKHILLEKAVQDITLQLKDINNSLKHQRSLNTKTMGELAQRVEESFIKLGLEQNQEETLMSFIETAENDSDEIFKTGEQTEKTFNQIIERLNILL